MNSHFTIAPIALFVYKRKDHLEQTLQALYKNRLVPQTDLYIFSDAPKTADDAQDVKNIRSFIKSITGFKSITIHEQAKNLGVAGSIVSGVTSILSRHSTCIVIEDDIVVSASFLEFMNDALQFYKDDARIATISGYTYPHSIFSIPATYKHDVFLARRVFPWGWATWSDRWNKIPWDNEYYKVIKSDEELRTKLNMLHPQLSQWLIGKLNGVADTWSIQMTLFFLQKNMYTVYPIQSYTNNIGNDGSGSTRQHKPFFVHRKIKGKKKSSLSHIEPDQDIEKEFRAAGLYSNQDTYFSWYKRMCIFYDKHRAKKRFFYHTVELIKKIDRRRYSYRLLRKSVYFVFDIIDAIKRSPVVKKPYMLDSEINLFKHNLKKSDSVLEWGSGNSTLYFSQFVKKYTAIEHQKEWFNKIKKSIGRNTSILHVPVSAPYTPITGHGWNTDFEGDYEQFKDYILIFDTFKENFDVILIDGRARIECAKYIIPYIDRRTKIFVHDFERYELELQKYYCVEKRSDRMALLRKK
ncbi:MAG: hypothetical protein M3Q63_02505 [bacterium]|nr:hypothetical protein [bacterium]